MKLKKISLITLFNSILTCYPIHAKTSEECFEGVSRAILILI